MDQAEQKKVGQALTSRVSAGLTFIEFNYLNNHPTPDAAWIRNIYILLSFYTELLLKGIYVAKKQFENLTDLDNKLKSIGHNFVSAGEVIGEDVLHEFGIKSIHSEGHEYIVETEDGKFYVQDFNDIRYDFIDGRVRTLNGDEHIMFKKQIEIMEKINTKLKPLVWN